MCGAPGAFLSCRSMNGLKALIGDWRRHGRRASQDPLVRGLATLYSVAPLGIISLTAEGAIETVNEAFSRMLGYSERELKGRRPEELSHPEDREACARQLEGVRRGEQAQLAMEKRLLGKDGAVVWVRVLVTGVPGDPPFYIGAAVDITERKRAEDDYRALYDRTPVMMHSIDPDGRLVSVSDRWCEVMGYAREEVLGRRTVEFLDEESARRAESEVLPEFFRTGRLQDVPYRFRAKSGRPVDVLLSATSERDERGRVTRSLAVLVDVTERLKAEAEVRRLTAELEERVRQRTALLAAQQEASPDGILVTDADGRVVSSNRRFAQMWGIPDEVIATGCDEAALKSVLGKLEDPEGFVRRILELYSRGEERSFDEVRLLDGRVFERFSRPIGEPGGAHYGRVWYFHDVTARVERERLLREKSAALERSNADLEVFAFAASHNLAAPLRKMALLAGLLERTAGAKLGEPERDTLARIRSAAEEQGALVKELLAMSLVGRESRPPEPVDVAAVLRDVLAEMARELREARAEVALEELPRLRAHRALLHRMLQHLLANSLKFRRKEQPCRVRVGSRPAEGGVELFVSDNGIGFEQRFAAKIFEPFSQLHSSSAYRGHGIGLAFCRRVAWRYGGRISASGAPGAGTTVVVWLPDSMLA